MKAKAIFLLALTGAASGAIAGSGDVCLIKTAADSRMSGIIEEQSLYTKALEKAAGGVFSYLKNDNALLSGPLDLISAVSRTSTHPDKSNTEDRAVRVDYEAPKALSKKKVM